MLAKQWRAGGIEGVSERKGYGSGREDRKEGRDERDGVDLRMRRVRWRSVEECERVVWKWGCVEGQ